MRVLRVQTLDRFVEHEELLANGMLEELTRTSMQPSSAFTFFVASRARTASDRESASIRRSHVPTQLLQLSGGRARRFRKIGRR